MKRLKPGQHRNILAMAAVQAFLTLMVGGLIALPIILQREHLVRTLAVVIFTLSAPVFLAITIRGYQIMPHQTIQFHLTGAEVQGRLVPWSSIERVSHGGLLCICTMTLKSGEQLTYWLPPTKDVVSMLGSRRLYEFSTGGATRFRGTMFALAGITWVLSVVLYFTVPEARRLLGVLVGAGVFVALFGMLARESNRVPSTELLDFEFLELGVRYRDWKGREFCIESELTVNYKGITKTFPAAPTRSTLGDNHEIFHHHENGQDRIQYARSHLTRVDEPSPRR